MPNREEHLEFEFALTILLRSSCGIAHLNATLQRTHKATKAEIKRGKSLKKDIRGVL
jgi:hypothetical protein